MKQTNKIILLAAALAMTTASQAQLGGMLKRAAKNAAVNTASNAASGNSSGSDSGSGSGSSISAEKPIALNWNMYPQTPSVTLLSLLSGTEVSDNGNLRMNFYRATFVPNKTPSGETVDMIRNDNVAYTKIYFNDQFVKDGKYGDANFFMEGKQLSYEDDRNSSDIQLDKEGKYRIDFYAGGKMIHKFEFEVAKKTNDDPYATSNVLWYSKGPWDKYAYVTPQTTGNFIFGFYMMHTEFKPNPNDARSTSKKVIWYPELYKDGKLISVANKQTATVKRGEWDEFTTSMKLIGAKDYLKIAELADGNYSMKVKVDGEAAPRVYPFAMKGGQIVYSDKQDRTKNTDPLTLIEGWNNYFWLERK